METEKTRLTSFSRGAGCGCKVSPQVLDVILRDRREQTAGSLLVGSQYSDDAAVLRWEGEEALVSTVDFFAPLVDDPFVYGQSAAANALSDVYAMGGRPLLALAILAWPVSELPPEMAGQVLEGARDICRKAGIPLAGGHTVESGQPLFGLAVSGRVTISGLRTNAGARPGDALLLTRPLGTGILATAFKREGLPPDALAELCRSITYLNSVGARLGSCSWVHALTDLTGFGLLGHGLEMARASGCGIDLYLGEVPVLSPARPLVERFTVADATYRNWNAAEGSTEIDPGTDAMQAFSLLNDPQTNGGLLLAVPYEQASLAMESLREWNPEYQPALVGRFTASHPGRARVLPGRPD